jgi:Lon protease-like protein
MPVIKISDASFQSVPVFPLSGVSLFPQMSLPLHIFEPRYVELLQFALANERLIAIADVIEGMELPPLPPIIGAGVIVGVNKLPEGRFHVMLHGLTRLSLIRELPRNRSFRQAQAEILLDEEEREERLVAADLEVRELILLLSERHPQEREPLLSLLDNAPTPQVLSEVVPARLFQTREGRRDAFSTLTASGRLNLCVAELGRMLLEGGGLGEGH